MREQGTVIRSQMGKLRQETEKKQAVLNVKIEQFNKAAEAGTWPSRGNPVANAWNFEYKTCGFSWVKKNKKADSLFWGLGYYTRSNNEICLLATKGKPKRISSGVHQVVIDKIREHSRKPDCVRNRIVELCGDLPRIELFARQKADGWDSWGNEL